MTLPTEADLDALLSLAATVALEAGDIIRGHAGRLEEYGAPATKSSPSDLVTEADRASERHIVERLLAARPADAILGEEGAAIEGTSGVRWLIDPLDGTTNFVYGLAPYAVSICAEVDGQRLVGVVHDVPHGQTFSARLGGGAHLDGARIEVSGLADLSLALVGTGFAYLEALRRVQAETLLRVLPRVRDIRRQGAAALDLCAVAAGRIDAYYEEGLQPWDLAAGDVIVREAGGRTGGLDGTPVTSGSLIAATPAIFEALRELVSG